jgi:hypothetical protein
MPGEYTRKLKKLFGNFTKIINSKKKKVFAIMIFVVVKITRSLTQKNIFF